MASEEKVANRSLPFGLKNEKIHLFELPGHSESWAVFHIRKVGTFAKLEIFPQRNTEMPEGVFEMLSYRPR